MKKLIVLLTVLCLLLSSCGNLFSPDVSQSGNNGSSVGDNGSDNSAGNAGGSSDLGDNGNEDSGNTSGSDSGSGSTDGGSDNTAECADGHTDANDDGKCDDCLVSVLVRIDFYVINDLHGKLFDSDSQPGVDELTGYLKTSSGNDDYSVFLASGDMWQGSSESNLTYGLMVTDWMNYLGFDAMTLGNHDFDWGESYIESNAEAADFPFLAINVYDRATNARVDYCTPSIIIERGGIQIGVIGAIGDCYSSISSDKVQDVYFKVGDELTELVKAEATRLRMLGADYIIYSLHDGYESSSTSEKLVQSSKISYYYDTALSDGYVDLVFEGHTHQRYVFYDTYKVYHLQNGGENRGISHVEVDINSVTGSSYTRTREFISNTIYEKHAQDDILDDLSKKYSDAIEQANRVLGYNKYTIYGDSLRQLVADLYYEVGVQRWGEEYDIVLGGGYLSVRNPYNLYSGEVKYSDLHSIFPFDNEIVLCSIKGRDLKNRFFETSNTDYFISYGSYGEQIKNNIDLNATYFVIVDSYSSQYAPNNLTVIDSLGSGIYARDLLADYIEAGRLN